MVPRGRCEPEIMVGHTKVILDNPNYVETHVRDDIINGHLINVCARAHAARVSPKLTETAALPVSYEQCSSEWPPWPNFRAVQSSECSAIGAVWSNASKSEDDNFQSTVTGTVQHSERSTNSHTHGATESGFLSESGIATLSVTHEQGTCKDSNMQSKQSNHSSKDHSVGTATAAKLLRLHFANITAQEAYEALAMAYNTSPYHPRSTGPDKTDSFELKNFMKILTNEFWALCNHHQIAQHFCSILAFFVLCLLWIVACIQGMWHVGLTAVRMRRDVMTQSQSMTSHIINPVQMNAAVNVIDVIQSRQSCMHKVVYMICRRCRAWICISCGMVTVCSHHCTTEDISPGCWDHYTRQRYQSVRTRAELLNTYIHGDFNSLMEEMSIGLVEYLSARCGAINCDESASLGYDTETGVGLDNLQPYAGERIYKSPHMVSVNLGIQALKILTCMMRSAYLSNTHEWIVRPVREPRYLQLLTCKWCNLKARLSYCMQCSAWVCLTCGMLSACACSYGMNSMIGAHDWIEEWTEVHRERAPDSDITFVHDRSPNPTPYPNEYCPLCIHRNDIGEILEHGVGKLFIICFGCNRKYCTSAKPGSTAGYMPCQFSMECTCSDAVPMQCMECDDETNDITSMQWFDHVRLLLAGIHYSFMIAIKSLKAGVELIAIATVGILCACINYIPSMPVVAVAFEITSPFTKRFVRVTKDSLMSFTSRITNVTPQILMKQIMIEIIALAILIVSVNVSLSWLMTWSLMAGIHYLFHSLTYQKSHQFIHFVSIVVILTNLSTVYTVGNPNVERNEDILPGVKEWNGKRFYDFRIIWWPALLAALGSIAQEGWTLLQVARGQDPGAPGAGGTAAQQIQSVNRNIRLFNSMIKYIHNRSWLYQFATTQFPGDGRGLFNYVWEFGHKPLTTLKQTKLMDEWQHMSMANTCGKYKKDSIMDWAEQVDVKGARIGKTNAERRAKFYEGFPESFTPVIAFERMQMPVGNYIYPANYVAHDPRAGNPHPHAGEPDILACGRAFETEWERMIVRGLIKSAPRGSVHQVISSSEGESDNESANESTNESANMARAAISERTVCLECGGLFHAAIVDGKPMCPNLIMKNKVDRATLEQIKYPNGITRPKFNFNNKKGKAGDFKKKQHAQASNESNEQSSDDDDDDEANFTRKGKGKFGKKKFGKKKFVPKGKSKSAKQVVEPEPSGEETNDDEANEGEHEGGSAMMLGDSSDDSSSDDESEIMKLKRKIKSLKAKQMRNSQAELAVSFDDVEI